MGILLLFTSLRWAIAHLFSFAYPGNRVLGRYSQRTRSARRPRTESLDALLISGVVDGDTVLLITHTGQ